jgi:hypothetical protein
VNVTEPDVDVKVTGHVVKVVKTISVVITFERAAGELDGLAGGLNAGGLDAGGDDAGGRLGGDETGQTVVEIAIVEVTTMVE